MTTSDQRAIANDDRFSRVLWDPIFRKVAPKEHKVVIDKRFKGMFEDEQFKTKYVDMRGRPIKRHSTQDLHRYYELSDNSDNELDATGPEQHDGDVTSRKELAKARKKSSPSKFTVKRKTKLSTAKNELPSVLQHEPADDRLSSGYSEPLANGRAPKRSKRKRLPDSDRQKELSDLVLTADRSADHSPLPVSSGLVDQDDYEEEEEIKLDLARGDGNLETSSDSDSSSDWGEIDGDPVEIDHPWGEVDNNLPNREDATHRLAVCNLDWDRVRARDIFMLLNCFKPPDGVIHFVNIYPSEFGKTRMKEEDSKGPAELIEMESGLQGAESGNESSDSESHLAQKMFTEKLRKYQMNRLKYYYAIVDCDSCKTAEALYENCDGLEYELSATRLDLRFIADDVTFDDADVTDACHQAPDDYYEPVFFSNTALKQTSVRLTWDETDPNRQKASKDAFNLDKLDTMDLNNYFASSSSGSSSEVEGDAVDTDEAEASAQGKGAKSNQVKSGNHGKLANRYQTLIELAQGATTGGQNGTDSDRDDDDDVDMEITWEPGLKEKVSTIVKEKRMKEESTAESSGGTPWQNYLAKRKERRRQRRLEVKQKRDASKRLNDLVDDQQPFSDDDLPDDVDLHDPYFSTAPEKTRSKSIKSNLKADSNSVAAHDSIESTADNSISAGELALLLDDDGDEQNQVTSEGTRRHFDYQSIVKSHAVEEKRKGKKKGRMNSTTLELGVDRADDEAPLDSKRGLGQSLPPEGDSFRLNVSDPRFEAVYTAPDYSIDPSDPLFKRTAGMDQLIQHKIKRASQRYNSSISTAAVLTEPSLQHQPTKEQQKLVVDSGDHGSDDDRTMEMNQASKSEDIRGIVASLKKKSSTFRSKLH